MKKELLNKITSDGYIPNVIDIISFLEPNYGSIEIKDSGYYVVSYPEFGGTQIYSFTNELSLYANPLLDEWFTVDSKFGNRRVKITQLSNENWMGILIVTDYKGDYRKETILTDSDITNMVNNEIQTIESEEIVEIAKSNSGYKEQLAIEMGFESYQDMCDAYEGTPEYEKYCI